MSEDEQKKGVALAFDSWNMSTEFAEETEVCLNANGIKAYRFESLRPTQELSFVVREFGLFNYLVEDDVLTLTLIDTGTHADLFRM